MAKNERKRQMRLAKKKSKRKVKKTKLKFETALSSNLPGLAERAAKMPIYECFVPEELEENGIGSVVLSRKMSNGEIAFCVILLDIFCLGVKDNLFKVFSLSDYKDFKLQIGMGETLVPVEPAYARKLVEDCIAFARNIGFEPHSDYKYANKLFADIDAGDCTETFTFGTNGKPHYISGPHDNQQKIKKIQQTLLKNCGEGNFDFTVVVPDDLGFMFDE